MLFAAVVIGALRVNNNSIISPLQLLLSAQSYFPVNIRAFSCLKESLTNILLQSQILPINAFAGQLSKLSIL